MPPVWGAEGLQGADKQKRFHRVPGMAVAWLVMPHPISDMSPVCLVPPSTVSVGVGRCLRALVRLVQRQEPRNL